MDLQIARTTDEDTCYNILVRWLHPGGLACPRCRRPDSMRTHRRRRSPVLDYRCTHCRRIFNAFTATALHGTRRRPSELLRIVSGIARGATTAQLARELGCDRSELFRLRHKLEEATIRNHTM